MADMRSLSAQRSDGSRTPFDIFSSVRCQSAYDIVVNVEQALSKTGALWSSLSCLEALQAATGATFITGNADGEVLSQPSSSFLHSRVGAVQAARSVCIGYH